MFQVTHGEETIHLKAPDQKKRGLWVSHIEKASDYFKTLEKKKRKGKKGK
jgi:hypothetical protein